MVLKSQQWIIKAFWYFLKCKISVIFKASPIFYISAVPLAKTSCWPPILCFILMGIVHMPTTAMYWSSEVFFGIRGIQMVMTYNRFCQVLRYFHASDRSLEPPRGSDQYDRLFKVRPVMDILLATFRKYYVLSRDVAVHEAMIGFTGRLSFWQYMPAKPIKRGIKCWMLCD